MVPAAPAVDTALATPVALARSASSPPPPWRDRGCPPAGLHLAAAGSANVPRGIVVDDLGIDVAVRAKHRQARPLRGPGDFFRTRLCLRTRAAFWFWVHQAAPSSQPYRPSSTTRPLADALALVGIGLADLSNVRRHLAHQLPCRCLERRSRCPSGSSNSMPSGARARRPGRENPTWTSRSLPFIAAPVPDADDGEALLVTVRHALDHVRDQRAREAVQAPVSNPSSLGPLDPDRAILLDDLHLGVDALVRPPCVLFTVTTASSPTTDVDAARGSLDRLSSPIRLILYPGLFSVLGLLEITRRARGSRRRCPFGRRRGPSSRHGTSTRSLSPGLRLPAAARGAPRTDVVPEC